jgi:ATP-dependent Clp protease adapter protein ClpS
VDIAALVFLAGSFGLFWWRHSRRSQRMLAAPRLAEDAEVALHVAQHEAGTRGQWLTGLHVMRGLLQDEAFTAAIERLGGKVAPIEDRVLDELDKTPNVAPDEAALRQAIGTAIAIAEHQGRLATCTDIWAHLARTPAGQLVASGGVEPAALLFTLVHGFPEPKDLPAVPHVDLVLRNDDYTTQEVVVAILHDVFGLPTADAEARMLAAHQQGSAVLGRFTVGEARDKLAAVRERVRTRPYPLRIDAEPR